MNMINKTLAGALAALALTACGPLAEDNVANGVLDVVRTRFGNTPPPPAPTAPVLTRAQVDANPGGFVVLNAYNGSLVSAMALAGSNGTRKTYLSADGLSVTTQNGVLVATRGFPRDLMAADVGGIVRALIAGGGTATRTHEVLTDTDQIETLTFTCTITAQPNEAIGILGRQITAQRFKEDCQSDGLVFGNSYWIDGAGQMVRSQQAIAPESGYIQLDRP